MTNTTNTKSYKECINNTQYNDSMGVKVNSNETKDSLKNTKAKPCYIVKKELVTTPVEQSDGYVPESINNIYSITIVNQEIKNKLEQLLCYVQCNPYIEETLTSGSSNSKKVTELTIAELYDYAHTYINNLTNIEVLQNKFKQIIDDFIQTNTVNTYNISNTDNTANTDNNTSNTNTSNASDINPFVNQMVVALLNFLLYTVLITQLDAADNQQVAFLKISVTNAKLVQNTATVGLDLGLDAFSQAIAGAKQQFWASLTNAAGSAVQAVTDYAASQGENSLSHKALKESQIEQAGLSNKTSDIEQSIRANTSADQVIKNHIENTTDLPQNLQRAKDTAKEKADKDQKQNEIINKLGEKHEDFDKYIEKTSEVRKSLETKIEEQQQKLDKSKKEMDESSVKFRDHQIKGDDNLENSTPISIQDSKYYDKEIRNIRNNERELLQKEAKAIVELENLKEKYRIEDEGDSLIRELHDIAKTGELGEGRPSNSNANKLDKLSQKIKQAEDNLERIETLKKSYEKQIEKIRAQKKVATEKVDDKAIKAALDKLDYRDGKINKLLWQDPNDPKKYVAIIREGQELNLYTEKGLLVTLDKMTSGSTLVAEFKKKMKDPLFLVQNSKLINDHYQAPPAPPGSQASVKHKYELRLAQAKANIGRLKNFEDINSGDYKLSYSKTDENGNYESGLLYPKDGKLMARLRIVESDPTTGLRKSPVEYDIEINNNELLVYTKKAWKDPVALREHSEAIMPFYKELKSKSAPLNNSEKKLVGVFENTMESSLELQSLLDSARSFNQIVDKFQESKTFVKNGGVLTQKDEIEQSKLQRKLEIGRALGRVAFALGQGYSGFGTAISQQYQAESQLNQTVARLYSESMSSNQQELQQLINQLSQNIVGLLSSALDTVSKEFQILEQALTLRN
ncbi:MAG: hypothetical protein ACK5Z5_09795 [Neisseriaceae bacterium]